MEGRLDELVRIVEELQSGTVDVTHTPVHVRDEPGRHTLTVSGRVAAADLWDWLAAAHTRLLATAAALARPPPGCPGDLPAEIGEDDVEEVEAFVPIDAPVVVGRADDVRVGELPACRVARARARR